MYILFSKYYLKKKVYKAYEIIPRIMYISVPHVICMYELGEVNASWIPARPASVDQDHTRNNRHNPLMV